jgi:hypothetical protein
LAIRYLILIPARRNDSDDYDCRSNGNADADLRSGRKIVALHPFYFGIGNRSRCTRFGVSEDETVVGNFGDIAQILGLIVKHHPHNSGFARAQISDSRFHFRGKLSFPGSFERIFIGEAGETRDVQEEHAQGET